MKYYYAIPVQSTVRVKKAKNRGVAFRFEGRLPQDYAEILMNDLGYEDDQYYFQTEDKLGPEIHKFRLLIVQFKGGVMNQKWALKSVS